MQSGSHDASDRLPYPERTPNSLRTAFEVNSDPEEPRLPSGRLLGFYATNQPRELTSRRSAEKLPIQAQQYVTEPVFQYDGSGPGPRYPASDESRISSNSQYPQRIYAASYEPSSSPAEHRVLRIPPEHPQVTSWQQNSSDLRATSLLGGTSAYDRPAYVTEYKNVPYAPEHPITPHKLNQAVTPYTPPKAADGIWQRSSSPTPRRLGDTTFQYKDLDHAQNEIRLLRILPETTSIVKCEVFHTSLDNARSYIAISYTWGDAEDTRTIMLDGHEFVVTESLQLALQRLRSRDYTVIVWADAVCINQGNINERNHQVQLMTSIYSKAYTMAIWLGQEANDSNLAMELLSEIVKVEDSATMRDIIQSPTRRSQFEALVALFSRDYWKRLWVVQEIENARDITVYCGPGALSWETYTVASRLLLKHEPDLIRAFPSTTLALSGYTWVQVLVVFGPGRLRSMKRSDGTFPRLFDALIYHREKGCSDPKDKIYGILGILSPREKSQFPVDYNISTRDVYINVVDYLLTTTRRLDVICASLHFPIYQSSIRLPSWVPDWSQNPQVDPMGHRCRSFCASATTDAKFSFSGRRSKLQIAAIPIDTIFQCGTPLGPPISTDSILMAFFQWRCILISRFGYDVPWHEAFCRTLCLDQTRDRWASAEWMEWMYHAFGTLLREQLPELKLDDQLKYHAEHSTPMSTGLREQLFSDYIERAMAGRRFFISRGDLLCLGSGVAWPGDIICVPLGCSTPIVLREHSQGCYTYIGDIYVDGYMYGRAVEELNSGQRQVQTFVIS
jgi:hypothetical protein